LLLTSSLAITVLKEHIRSIYIRGSEDFVEKKKVKYFSF